MASTPLPLVEKAAGMGLEEALAAVVARRVSHEGMLTFCKFYRRLAIAKLLAAGVPDAFFEDLSRSARAYLYFLEGTADDAKATSKAEPFFDAIACGDLQAAAGIASHSRPTRNEGKEYEDDFLYLWFLMKRFGLGAGAAELDGLLRRWEAVLSGDDDLRLPVCRALHARDQQAWDEAFPAFAERHAQEVRRLVAEQRLPLDDVPTRGKVSIELLALLHLAERAGLRGGEQVSLAPSLARRLDRAKLPPPGSWRDVGTYRELG